MRLTSILLLAAAAPLAAQQPAAIPAPGVVKRSGEWNIRYDRPGTPESSLTIVAQAPGFHVTTNGRGSAIAWRANQTATGNFRADLDLLLLPVPGSHAEAAGMILGGANLDGDNQTYLYFLVRKDGMFAIKHRAGNEVHTVVDWTANAAVARQEGNTNATERLSVEARRDSVIFSVNGQRVHASARASTPVDGIAGLRVNHGLVVHVTRLQVTPSR